MSKEIAERWAKAKLLANGTVHVPGCDDPREDVFALLEGKRAADPKKARKKPGKKADK